MCLIKKKKEEEKQKDSKSTEEPREMHPIKTDWDTSFRRTLDPGNYQLVICYTCAKGERGDWEVNVGRLGYKRVKITDQC